jgi:adenylate cyclase
VHTDAIHRRLGVRVGVHTGTAVRRGGDWFGSAVNLASRVADLARAGEVLLTDATRHAIEGGLAVRELGPRSLKHVARPLRVYSPVREENAAGLPADPVCHMALDPERAAARHTLREVEHYLCSPECASAFAGDPGRYISLG